MNDASVREARERVRQHANNLGNADIADRNMLVLENLGEHHADDDLPITEEWLRSVGFKAKTYQGDTVLALRIAKGPIGDDQWLELNDETNGVFLLCRWSPIYDDDTPPDRVEVVADTRGDLRGLCHFLHSPLKETDQQCPR
jgi:hypothetical protein